MDAFRAKRLISGQSGISLFRPSLWLRNAIPKVPTHAQFSPLRSALTFHMGRDRIPPSTPSQHGLE